MLTTSVVTEAQRRIRCLSGGLPEPEHLTCGWSLRVWLEEKDIPGPLSRPRRQAPGLLTPQTCPSLRVCSVGSKVATRVHFDVHFTTRKAYLILN